MRPRRAVSPASQLISAKGSVNENTIRGARTARNAAGILAHTNPATSSANKIGRQHGQPPRSGRHSNEEYRRAKILARGSRRCSPLSPRLHLSRTTWCKSGAPAARHHAADREARHVNQRHSRPDPPRPFPAKSLDRRRLIARQLLDTVGSRRRENHPDRGQQHGRGAQRSHGERPPAGRLAHEIRLNRLERLDTARVIAPSSTAETRNTTSESPSAAAGIGTFENSNSAKASRALTRTESIPPAKIAARRQRPAPKSGTADIPPARPRSPY